MLSFRSRATARLKKAGPGADDANDDVKSSVDNASTIGSVRARARSLRECFGFRASSKIKGSDSGSGSASGMESVDSGKSGNDNRDSASRELLVKRSEDYGGNNNATIKSAGVDGNNNTLKHSEEDGVNKITTVKHPENGNNFKDGDDKNDCDRIDKQQGSGSDSDRAAADPDGTGREASAEDKTSAASTTSQLTGTALGFNTPAHPPNPQQITNFPRERFPSRPLRPPGPGQPVNAQLRRPPPRAPTPTAGPAFRASATSGPYPPSNLRPYSAASTTSSSATMTPAMYARRNFPVENRQMQYPPPRRFHNPQQQPSLPQQSSYYQPPQGPAPIRSGGGFHQSHSSSSSAKTGNSSSSLTTQSLESAESPPPLEPNAPNTKSCSEEFITPSQTPNLEKARASPGPYYSQNHGPSNPQLFGERPHHPEYPYPQQQRTVLRPLRSAPFFHEGLYFAQISYNTAPKEAITGPELSYVQYPPFQLVHFDCMIQHKIMHKVHNLHHSVPCMACRTMGHRDTIGTVDRSDDPTEYRFVCAWCAIRICAGCRGELRFQDNRLMALLRVIQEREQRNDLGDPNATSALNIDIQPRAPKLENTQLPTDFSALTPATSSEELLNLSHFGSPGFSGGSTPISRPGTDSSGSETGGPQRRLTEFEEYDGEPCWPPPPRGKRYPTLDQRAELTNIEEYPRQRIPSHQPSQPSGANTQKSYQHLSDPPQWNPHGSSPQPRGPFNPQRRSPEADSPEPELGSDGESETPVESTAGRQMQQQVQPPRQESPLRQEPPPRRQVSPPREPSPPQREATLRSTLRVTGQPEVPLAPPKSPRRKESPPISVPTISMVDTPNMLKVDEPEVTHSEVMQPELKNPGVKQSAINQQPTPKLDQPQVEKKQERRTESPLPIPRPQRESTPRLDKLPRSTPSPRPEPTQVTKMEEKREASSPMSLVKPLPIKKLPEPGVVKPEPAPKPIPKPAEPVLATKQEKPVPTPAKQEKALPEPPKLVKPTIGDFPISKPDTPPAERPVYPTKPEPKVDLSYYYNLEPVATQERLPIADSMQLPEIDFGGTLDTVDISGGFLGRPARTHEKPPAAPIRLGEEKEGSIAGSMKDKKKWRLPGFGKKVEKK